MVALLAAAAYFRMVGLDWDEGQHLHPDERFLTMVETAIMPPGTPQDLLGPAPSVALQPWRQNYVGSLSECSQWGGYFDTSCSPLNPANRGHSFYVYGTLPLFIVRYVAEWSGQSGYDRVNLVGRQLSAFADLGAIFLMYVIALRLFGRKVALLATAFNAGTVLLIQQAHFFTVDNFANFFIFLAIFFAVNITLDQKPEVDRGRDGQIWKLDFLRNRLLANSAGFGIALGMAAASKITAAPLALLLPGALAVRWARRSRAITSTARPQDLEPSGSGSLPSPDTEMKRAATLLLVGGVAAFLAFRIFQPYAFLGPGFFGLEPNPQWLANLQEIQRQASGEVDFPPALQWARRTALFPLGNMVTWGFGLPLGILAWTGFCYMGLRILRGDWNRYILLWGWTLAYFTWQSLAWNSTMRYHLPVYPLLATFAAWFVVEFASSRLPFGPPRLSRAAAWVLGGFVLLATTAWALAFTSIYQRPHTRVAASRWIYSNIPGPLNLRIVREDGSSSWQPIPLRDDHHLQPGSPYKTSFVARADGLVRQVGLWRIDAPRGDPLPLTISVSASGGDVLSVSQVTAATGLDPILDTDGEGQTLQLDQSFPVVAGETYLLTLSTSGGPVTLSGAAPVVESSWDDGLPLRMDGFDGYGGIYRGGLNLEVYFNDDPEKLQRFLGALDQGDFIFISSNRQWATTVRVPERYPLTAAYYRNLLGCPADDDIIWCYNVARPGMFEGALGFRLVEVFESFPTLGPWQVNDQFAEEAFTVYDHPKVLIFQKTPGYSDTAVRNVLGRVDLNRVVPLTPRQASHYKDLLLPADQLALQSRGGTWSELFSYDALPNRNPIAGLILWYLAVFVLGLSTYPVFRMLVPGLSDRGYPLSRISGLLILAYLSWLAGALGGSYSRGTIAMSFGLILAAGVAAAIVQRETLWAEARDHRRYFLFVEALFLAVFVIAVLVRLGNPDLWHPARGGERPMDFAYLNAVIKSSSFPPYDPWFAGGYINYYYWGFVLVGTLVKLLGIVPSIAYNFILPTLLALAGIAAFSVAFNLVAACGGSAKTARTGIPFRAGVAGLTGMVLIGNLGTVRMIFRGLQQLVVPAEQAGNPETSIFKQLWWGVQAIPQVLSGRGLPFGAGDWYWIPSRVIPAPGEVAPITEFPLFTFLYGDLHAHLIALPLTLLALSWALAVVMGRAKWRGTSASVGSFLLGGMVIGSLRATNTWDFPTYLTLGSIAVAYTTFRYADVRRTLGFAPVVARTGLALLNVALLVTASFVLYEPYSRWYALGYSRIGLWAGTHTPVFAYLTHWGLFLLVILVWMVWETREWMATTPVSALGKLRPYQFLIKALLVLLVALVAITLYFEIHIGWLLLPLLAWTLILIVRPGQSDAKRVVLAMVGTALMLTLVVEIVVLVGDIARMNTVFKFYMQAWILLAVSTAAAVGWLVADVHRWNRKSRDLFTGTASLLLAGALLFTLTATLDKIRDRMAPDAPRTFDAIAYMADAKYFDGREMDLEQDYRAIRWMQEHVQATPVIIEGYAVEYRWGARYAVHTGLPSVLGWNWHQRQQRAVTPSTWVTDRIEEIKEFYTTTDPTVAIRILARYGVKYIIVGQMERIYYPGSGLQKFEEADNGIWTEVYRDPGGQTVIYEVSHAGLAAGGLSTPPDDMTARTE